MCSGGFIPSDKGGGSSRPWGGEPGLQFGLKIRGGGCDPPGTLPCIRHWCGQVKEVGLGEEPGPHGPVLFSIETAPPPPPPPPPHPLWADSTFFSPLYSSAFKIKDGRNCALFKTASFLVAHDLFMGDIWVRRKEYLCSALVSIIPSFTAGLFCIWVECKWPQDAWSYLYVRCVYNVTQVSLR